MTTLRRLISIAAVALTVTSGPAFAERGGFQLVEASMAAVGSRRLSWRAGLQGQ